MRRLLPLVALVAAAQAAGALANPSASFVCPRCDLSDRDGLILVGGGGMGGAGGMHFEGGGMGGGMGGTGGGMGGAGGCTSSGMGGMGGGMGATGGGMGGGGMPFEGGGMGGTGGGMGGGGGGAWATCSAFTRKAVPSLGRSGPRATRSQAFVVRQIAVETAR